jgi:hypothetical protein
MANGDEHLEVKLVIPGVVLPGWTVVLLAFCLVFAASGFLLAYLQVKEQSREIRVLQLHVQDLESVVIRSGLATRDELALWHPTRGSRARPPARETEKE